MQAKINRMMESAETMEFIRRQLNACMEETRRIVKDLQELSFMKEPAGRVQDCEVRLGQQIRLCGQFSLALENICHMYSDYENRIIDDFEGLSRTAARADAKLQDLSKLNEMFQGIFC